MTWSSPLERPTQIVPVYLDRFAQQLQDLSLEVRTSVAGLAGDAIGRAVRDVLLGFWKRSSDRVLRRPERYAWNRDEWDQEEEAFEGPAETPLAHESPIVLPTPNLATVLQLAGWLLQNGTLVGLLGTGLSVGGLTLLRNRLKPSHSELIRGVADMASLLMLLNSGARHLRTR